MSKISRDDLLKLAQLSKLKLSEAELQKFAAELEGILEYVEMLSDVDTTGLEPTYQLSNLKYQHREDEIRNDGPYAAATKDLLKNAPASQNNQFQVKRVLE